MNPWVLAARPATLPAGAAAVVVGSALAAADGVFRWDAFLVTLLAAIAIQVGDHGCTFHDHVRIRSPQRLDLERRGMVGSGDRSEKIRTYNFPQNRVTDHRIGFTSHNLAGLLDGDLEPLLQALATHDQAERLEREVQAAG